MKKKKFSVQERINSFKYAFDGLKTLFKEEHNARIHLGVSLFVIALGFYFDVSSLEWICLIFAIGFVFAAEVFNTSLETMADFVSKEQHPQIKKIKDLAALAVLISAITAVIIGLIIFLPKLF